MADNMPAPGWYDDPELPHAIRKWNGRTWDPDVYHGESRHSTRPLKQQLINVPPKNPPRADPPKEHPLRVRDVIAIVGVVVAIVAAAAIFLSAWGWLVDDWAPGYPDSIDTDAERNCFEFIVGELGGDISDGVAQCSD